MRDFQSQNPAGVCLCHMFERDKVFIAGGDANVSTSFIIIIIFKTTTQLAPNEASFPLSHLAFPNFTLQGCPTVEYSPSFNTPSQYSDPYSRSVLCSFG